MCRCGCAGANMPTTPPLAPAAPNVGLTFVPAIQTPTVQTGPTPSTVAIKRDWLDYLLAVLIFIAAVNATRS